MWFRNQQGLIWYALRRTVGCKVHVICSTCIESVLWWFRASKVKEFSGKSFSTVSLLTLTTLTLNSMVLFFVGFRAASV